MRLPIRCTRRNCGAEYWSALSFCERCGRGLAFSPNPPAADTYLHRPKSGSEWHVDSMWTTAEAEQWNLRAAVFGGALVVSTNGLHIARATRKGVLQVRRGSDLEMDAHLTDLEATDSSEWVTLRGTGHLTDRLVVAGPHILHGTAGRSGERVAALGVGRRPRPTQTGLRLQGRWGSVAWLGARLLVLSTDSDETILSVLTVSRDEDRPWLPTVREEAAALVRLPGKNWRFDRLATTDSARRIIVDDCGEVMFVTSSPFGPPLGTTRTAPLRDCTEVLGVTAMGDEIVQMVRLGRQVRLAAWDDTRSRWTLLPAQRSLSSEAVLLPRRKDGRWQSQLRSKHLAFQVNALTGVLQPMGRPGVQLEQILHVSGQGFVGRTPESQLYVESYAGVAMVHSSVVVGAGSPTQILMDWPRLWSLNNQPGATRLECLQSSSAGPSREAGA